MCFCLSESSNYFITGRIIKTTSLNFSCGQSVLSGKENTKLKRNKKHTHARRPIKMFYRRSKLKIKIYLLVCSLNDSYLSNATNMTNPLRAMTTKLYASCSNVLRLCDDSSEKTLLFGKLPQNEGHGSHYEALIIT